MRSYSILEAMLGSSSAFFLAISLSASLASSSLASPEAFPTISTSDVTATKLASPNPGTPQSAEQVGRSTREISVMGFNVMYDAKDINKSIEVIDESNSDIVCLTELTSRFAGELENRLGNKYPYRNLKTAEGTWGLGILSKMPFSNVHKFEQKPHKMPAVEATFVTANRPLIIACLHLFPPVSKRNKSDGFFKTMEKNADLRRQQADYIVRRFAKRNSSIVLVGDMNEGPDGKAIKLLKQAGYSHACNSPDSRCGNTYPGAASNLPALFEVDHILGRGVVFKSARVIRLGSSDHFPVAASFSTQ